jgi:ABC-type branched-subunit amino acid transport system ATPase component
MTSGIRRQSAARGAVETLLAVDAVDFSYGPIQVLFGVSLRVPKGGRVALLGPNGAGKSTLLGVISGLLRPSRGSVWFDGGDISEFTPEERAQVGISQVPGGRAIFPSMTVEENLWLGTYPFAAERQLVKARLEAVLTVFPPLRGRLRQTAGTLSGGEQQMVSLGRALMAGPELLMADELSLGLAPVITESLFRVLEHIVELGTSLLIVEQSVNVALGIADEVYFMQKGEVRHLGAADQWSDHEELARSAALGQGT